MYYNGGKKGTLCWDCANACGGCAWSKQLIPVNGWEAVKTHSDEFGDGYRVTGCPQFVRDSDEMGQVRLGLKDILARTNLDGEEKIPNYRYTVKAVV